jgi:hypothetical protein
VKNARTTKERFFFFTSVSYFSLNCCLQTISGDDILFALKEMGFDNYVEPMRLYLLKYRESQPVQDEKNDRSAKKRSKKDQEDDGEENGGAGSGGGHTTGPGMSMQQQMALQQMMSMQHLMPGLIPVAMAGGELSPEQTAMLSQLQASGGFNGMQMPAFGQSTSAPHAGPLAARDEGTQGAL